MKANKVIILTAVGLAILAAVYYLMLRFSINEQATRAIAVNDAVTLKQCLARGYNVNCRAIDGGTPLHVATMTSHVKDKLAVVKVLIENGADINTRNKEGLTPLHHAAYTGNLEVVRLLIKNGADIKAKSNDGRTPLDIATRMHNNKVAAELIKSQGKRP